MGQCDNRIVTLQKLAAGVKDRRLIRGVLMPGGAILVLLYRVTMNHHPAVRQHVQVEANRARYVEARNGQSDYQRCRAKGKQ